MELEWMAVIVAMLVLLVQAIRLGLSIGQRGKD